MFSRFLCNGSELDVATEQLTTAQEEEEVWCECSDDEMYNPCKLKKGTWEPKAEDMIRLFDELKTKKVLELSWKCPGRRPPESEVTAEEEIKQEPVSTPPKQEEKKQAVPNKFDFDDDSEPKAVLTPRWTPGSTPRPQKKVARMDKVLKDMMQQRKQQAAEREARKLAKSPRAPGSPSRARIGSPAGSPRAPPVSQSNRQSPVRSVAPAEGTVTAPSIAQTNRHSPIRSVVQSEGVMTTPLRAPVDSDTARLPVSNMFGAGLNTSQSISAHYTPTSQALSAQQHNRPPSREKNQSPKGRDIPSPATTINPAGGSVSSGKPSDFKDTKPVASNEDVRKETAAESMDTS